MIDLDGLEPEFRDKYIAVMKDCIAADIRMIPETGLVSVVKQARLWRRSRTDNQIDQAIYNFEHNGAEFLANVLKTANSPVGIELTKDLPGYTWHNFGEEVEWNIPAFKENLASVKKIAKKHDLTVSVSFLQNICIRKSPFASPIEVYSLQEIDKLMKEKWGS